MLDNPAFWSKIIVYDPAESKEEEKTQPAQGLAQLYSRATFGSDSLFI